MRDSVLVKRVLSGDRAAGEQFVAAHYTRVSRMLRHLTGSAEVGEDLTQQTFMKAWQGLARFRGEAALATWLHRIAYFEYTHWLRDRRAPQTLADAERLPDRAAAQEMEAVLLRRALDRLPQDLRDAFVLFHVEELSVAEVAQVMEIPVGTVKSRLFTARRHLRELLQETLPASTTASAETRQTKSLHPCESEGGPPR